MPKRRRSRRAGPIPERVRSDDAASGRRRRGADVGCAASGSGCVPRPLARISRRQHRPSAPAQTTPRKPAATGTGTAEFDRLVRQATEARQAEHWEEAIALYAQGGQDEADLRRGILVPGHRLLHAGRLHQLPRGVSKGRATGAEERRRVRVPRTVRVRSEGLRPLAAAPAAVADSTVSATRRSLAAWRATTRQS